jgi:hypothetical protein
MSLSQCNAHAFARKLTASEIAALRALRHKIVEPPDGEYASSSISNTQKERVHDVVLP